MSDLREYAIAAYFRIFAITWSTYFEKKSPRFSDMPNRQLICKSITMQIKQDRLLI